MCSRCLWRCYTHSIRVSHLLRQALQCQNTKWICFIEKKFWGVKWICWKKSYRRGAVKVAAFLSCRQLLSKWVLNWAQCEFSRECASDTIDPFVDSCAYCVDETMLQTTADCKLLINVQARCGNYWWWIVVFFIGSCALNASETEGLIVILSPCGVNP